MSMKFIKGQTVVQKFNYAGLTTEETFSILRIDKKGVWLDNGDGNDPSGPFNPTTGRHVEYSEKRIVELKKVEKP